MKKVTMLFAVMFVVIGFLSFVQVVVADDVTILSIAGKTFAGTYTSKIHSMGVTLVVTWANSNGSEGVGKITFFPHTKKDTSCMGEFETTLILDGQAVKMKFFRPACSNGSEGSYTFAIKDGGNRLESAEGGVLKIEK